MYSIRDCCSGIENSLSTSCDPVPVAELPPPTMHCSADEKLAEKRLLSSSIAEIPYRSPADDGTYIGGSWKDLTWDNREAQRNPVLYQEHTKSNRI